MGGSRSPEGVARKSPTGEEFTGLGEIAGAGEEWTALLYYGELIIVKYIAGINAASQEVFSTCDNRLACYLVMYKYMLVYMPHLRRCSPGLGES